MASKTSPILVTAATGRHGGTGTTVVKTLLERGYRVKALARKHDERSAALSEMGAEVVIGELHDRRSLILAFEGVELAYFAYPVAAGVVNAAANFAAAGRDAGLKRVVVMSMGVANPESPSYLGRAQWLAEEILAWAGFTCLNLRIMALFVENFFLLHGEEIQNSDIIQSSFGDAAMSWITGEDAGRLAVAAMLNPEKFGEEISCYPSGGPQLTYAEVASIIGKKRGRPLKHETISKDSWRDQLVALSAKNQLVSVEMAKHISTVGVAIQQSPPMNNLFEDIMGEKPTSFSEAISSSLIK